MIRASAEFFSRIMQRWLPDTFVIAIILTAVVFLAGMVTQGQGIGAMADHWGNGVWKLLGFSMQMVLILVLGTVLAMSRPVKAALRAIARVASTPSQGIILVTLTSMMALWVNWGFGLVVGALLAREVASHVKNSHFPLLIAAAYSGLLVWHSGLSGSIPLKIASTGDDALSQLLNGQTVPLLETIFAWQNIAIIIALAISLPILNILMMPDKNNRLGLAAEEEPEPAVDLTAMSPAEKLEHYPIINYLLVAIGAVYLFGSFSSGRSISLNEINLCLLLAGLALHINPRNYLNAMNSAIGTSSGIILQFPLYAGVMGMMVGSGLAGAMSQWFVDISSAQSFPVITFLSAGVVNFFVPSGGGQWAVQAPIVVPAAAELGVPVSKAAMAVAWGDAWTNMIQPFWALPLLALSGLNLRQIMGYCVVILLWSGALICSMIYSFY
ncbi:MAG: short-chain fatty acid transporter [Porticoccaceae bacterium]|jgi:short-chain fatty acids transporter|nr:short-chain fatty acid transporter [Porticoccaceae bacterium]